jgi:hypothetical protein
MKSAVFLASVVFWLSVLYATFSLLNGTADGGTFAWATGSFFWLRFEACLAWRGQETQQ